MWVLRRIRILSMFVLSTGKWAFSLAALSVVDTAGVRSSSAVSQQRGPGGLKVEGESRGGSKNSCRCWCIFWWVYAMRSWGFEEGVSCHLVNPQVREVKKKKKKLQHFRSAWLAELGGCWFRQHMKAEALLLCSWRQYLHHSNGMGLCSGLGKAWFIFLPHWCVNLDEA